MSSSALPPLGNLPSWSRVSSLDRSRYPKPFLRDRLQTLPPAGGKLAPTTDGGQAQVSMDIQLLENLTAAEQQRLVYYDKSIKFLQQQHADTLQKLHEEIDLLKQENKDLQFKYVMGHVAQSPTNPDRKSSSVENSEDFSQQSTDIQSMLLQEEVKDLRQALKNSQGRNVLLQHALQLQNNRKKSSTKTSSASPQDSVFSPEHISSASIHSGTLREPSYLNMVEQERPLPFGATLNPSRVRSSPQVASRSPSLEECEVIIKYLHRLSARQTEENQLLKSDLKTLLYPNKAPSSHKVNYEERMDESTKLPRVSFKDSLPDNKSQNSSNIDRVSLPALKQTINTNVAERKKRQQAIQKSRIKRDYQHQV